MKEKYAKVFMVGCVAFIIIILLYEQSVLDKKVLGD
jgi:hypothetical protein